mmetsp:Transcript_12578/g.25301  ORF Transcript_12578/g.25301 Transcript_12578/m.25301 type:complete len:229 (-) Transcript_12578:544-1230(-)
MSSHSRTFLGPAPSTWRTPAARVRPETRAAPSSSGGKISCSCAPFAFPFGERPPRVLRLRISLLHLWPFAGEPGRLACIIGLRPDLRAKRDSNRLRAQNGELSRRLRMWLGECGEHAQQVAKTPRAKPQENAPCEDWKERTSSSSRRASASAASTTLLAASRFTSAALCLALASLARPSAAAAFSAAGPTCAAAAIAAKAFVGAEGPAAAASSDAAAAIAASAAAMHV